MRTNFSGNPLVIKCISFSLSVIRYVELLEERRKFVVAKQLLKSATAIGANVMEAQSAESKADFIHKLKIADKEAYETWYWLLLCEQSESYPFDTTLSSDLNEIMRLLNSIINKSKN